MSSCSFLLCNAALIEHGLGPLLMATSFYCHLFMVLFVK